jgi:ATP-dependent DNA helicase MPH1
VWSASAQAQNSSPRRKVTAAHPRPTQRPRDSNDSPVSSQPVRPPKRKIGKPDISPSNLMSSPSVMPPPAGPRRLQRRQSPSPSPVPKKVSLKPKKREVPVGVRRHDPWIDHEAVHSGDEVSEGSSQVDEVETESDRRFLEAPPETQVSPSYDQTLAYRQSLLTQPPLAGRAPVFANRPVRRGIFRIGGVASTSRRRFAAFSSSPPREDDRYVFDSFVVDDDAEVLYAGPSSDI